MSLTPNAKVTLGNLMYDSQLSDIRATLSLLPGVSSVRAMLPSSVEVSAAAGDPAKLELDGGEGLETVLTGKVRAVRRGLLLTEACAADACIDLHQLRPCATYEKQSAKDVIKALAGDAGADVGSLSVDLPLASYVAHQGRTAAEHVASLARLGGALASFNADGELDVAARPEGQPDSALLYGREVISYEVRESAAPQARRVMAGFGPAGSPEMPDALRHSLAALPGGSPAAGASAFWRAVPILKSPSAAQSASAAADSAAATATKLVRARCIMLPALRPGSVVEVKETPGGVSGGPWLVTRVTHRLRPGLGGSSFFEGEAAGAGDLLGALLGAIGGLF